MSEPKEKKLPSFEQSIEELEQIIERIEAGETDLKQSLSFYETGMKLITHCRQMLERAELRIRELNSEGEDGLKVADSDRDAPADDASDSGGSDEPDPQ